MSFDSTLHNFAAPVRPNACSGKKVVLTMYDMSCQQARDLDVAILLDRSKSLSQTQWRDYVLGAAENAVQELDPPSTDSRRASLVRRRIRLSTHPRGRSASRARAGTRRKRTRAAPPSREQKNTETGSSSRQTRDLKDCLCPHVFFRSTPACARSVFPLYESRIGFY